jgi:molybdenum cofactor guanylyltransferase
MSPSAPPESPATVTAVVLCGGDSRRFGSDKTQADLGGSTVLDALLTTLPVDWAVVCVGPERPSARTRLLWTRENPPGGGPVAGVAAALPLVESAVVVLLGGDMPYAGPMAASLARRLGEEAGVEVVVGRDETGRLQPLLAAYRANSLRAAVPESPAGTPASRLLDTLRELVIPVPPQGTLDVDTLEDLEEARNRLDP